MALFGWFKKNKKNEKVQVSKQRQNVLRDAAAAAAFAEAGEHEIARSIIDKPKGKRTILVIGCEDRFSEVLVEYSLSMAKRLGFELLALNVTDTPLSMPAAKREEATVLFNNSSAENVAVFQEQAAKNGVAVNHLVEVGEQDEIVEKLRAKYPGMRYVLIEPDPEVAKKANGKVTVPVFDLACYQGAAV